LKEVLKVLPDSMWKIVFPMAVIGTSMGAIVWLAVYFLRKAMDRQIRKYKKKRNNEQP
jgi:hypothetical protein